MKTHPSRRNDGFTLVELLVVIAIIAVLAGAGFAAANSAIQKAKKTTALASATAIDTAVNNFFSDYGSMPKDGMTSDTEVNTKSNISDFMNVLLGLESSTGTPLNSKAVKFLSAQEGKRKGSGGINGLIYNTGGTAVEGMFDPWGGPYYVILDGNYDEKVAAKTAKDASALNLNGRRSAVWSNGADGVKLGDGAAADDVRTWQK